MATWLKLGQWFRKQKLVAVLKPWGKSLSKRKQEKKSPAMERHRSGANAWLWIKAPPGRAGTGTTQSSWNLRTLDQWGWEGDPHELGSPPPVYSTGKCAHHEPHECLTSSPLFLSFLVATSYQGPRILSLRVGSEILPCQDLHCSGSVSFSPSSFISCSFTSEGCK